MNYYFQKLRDNIFNPAYYREVLSAPLSAGFWYYLKMCLWLTLIYTAFISVVFLPDMINIARRATTELSQAFPDTLAIRLRNGVASVNLPEPIIIPLPPAEAKLFNLTADKTGKTMTNFLVIDTREAFSTSDFGNYHSLFLLRKDALAGDTGNGVQVNKIPADANVIIDKNAVLSLADKVQIFIYVLAPLSVLIIYILGIAFFALSLVPILVIAFLSWLLLLLAAKSKNVRPSFKQVFGVAMHAVTLSLIANFITFTLYPSISVNFPFMVTFSLLVVYLNLIRQPKVVYVPPVMPKNIPADTINTSTADEKKEEKKEEDNDVEKK